MIMNYEGTDGNYIVAPNDPIVATLRGTNWYPCDYNGTSRECLPLGRWDLMVGDNIDFSFGLGASQVIMFYYGIFPIGGD
jgi:hypothetical protein